MTKTNTGNKRDAKPTTTDKGAKSGGPGARSSDAPAVGKDGRNANDKDGNEAQRKSGKTASSRR